LDIKALTFNLQWKSCHGSSVDAALSSAIGLVVAAAADLVALQDCEDVSKVLIHGKLHEQYGYIQGPHSLAIAFQSAAWELLAEGAQVVAVDEAAEFAGSRSVQWARLSNKESRKTVFFMNHHGPLRVNSGGRHGGPATAARILKAIFCNVQPGDAVILLGSFNAQVGSQTIRELERFLVRTSSGSALGGVDHVFSALELAGGDSTVPNSLGTAGCEHEALVSTFRA